MLWEHYWVDCPNGAGLLDFRDDSQRLPDLGVAVCRMGLWDLAPAVPVESPWGFGQYAAVGDGQADKPVSIGVYHHLMVVEQFLHGVRQWAEAIPELFAEAFELLGGLHGGKALVAFYPFGGVLYVARRQAGRRFPGHGLQGEREPVQVYLA